MYRSGPVTAPGVVLAIVALTVASSLPWSGARPAVAQDIKPIGEVQGTIGDTTEASGHRSPFAGSQTQVVVQAVIYERSFGLFFNDDNDQTSEVRGLYVQNTAATADGDPNTSDGIFVFTGRHETLLRDDGSVFMPQVGDEVVLRGRVSEFRNQTQLSNPRVLSVVRSGVDLQAELPAFEANPPFDPATGGADPAEVARYWERREGMRGHIAPGSIVTGPTHVFRREQDGELAVIHPDHPVAQRSDPFARRAFRDPHPLDNLPTQLFDDDNVYRILLGSRGVKAMTASIATMVAPRARSFDVVAAPSIGAVGQHFDKYMIHLAEQPVLAAGPDPSLNAPPQPPDRTREYSIATFNVENLYDFRDDPTDDCDIHGDAGCPPDAMPPFDYPPTSDADYRAHLEELADQILQSLHSPDLLLIQEAEDQDICIVDASGTGLVCDTASNPTPESSRDGKPDTLQELALLIASKGGPTYDAASDPAGADNRGIVAGFMYRTDRVQLLPVPTDDPVLSDHPTVVYTGAPVPSNARIANPKALNAMIPPGAQVGDEAVIPTIHPRGPQVGLFRITPGEGGAPVDLYAISNHFNSGPDTRIRRRREQAKYAAALVAALVAGDPQVRIAVGGDFNVYPRPDDPVLPPSAPSDQLAALYEQGLHNLYDRLVAEVPAAAYSYVFDTQVQVLDQIYVTDPLFGALETIRVAHVNSDWPRDVPDDGPRRSSDHDPSVARFRF